MLWGPVRGAPAAGPWALGLCTRAPTREAASPASAAPPSARGWRAWVGGLPLPVPVLTSQLGNPSKSAHLWPRSSSARGRGPGARGGVESGHVNQPADAPVLGWRSKTGRGRGGGGGAGSWRPDTGLRSKPTPPPPSASPSSLSEDFGLAGAESMEGGQEWAPGLQAPALLGSN